MHIDTCRALVALLINSHTHIHTHTYRYTDIHTH
jgi:hypothetical protein